jgi:hypothetical protein
MFLFLLLLYCFCWIQALAVKLHAILTSTSDAYKPQFRAVFTFCEYSPLNSLGMNMVAFTRSLR